MKKAILLLLAMTLLVQNALSYLALTKTSQQSAAVGDIITIAIDVENTGDAARTVTVVENLGNEEPIDTNNLIRDTIKPDMIGYRLPYYRWEFTLQPKEIKKLEYRIKADRLRNIELGPAEASSGNEVFLSNPLSVKVNCNANGACETHLEENSLTCRDDCPTGSKDGFCDLVQDGRCDPDCAGSADQDCIVCGDGKCSGGESSLSCPKDCAASCTGPDCKSSTENEPPVNASECTDCGKEPLSRYFFIALYVILAAVFIYFAFKKIKGSEK